MSCRRLIVAFGLLGAAAAGCSDSGDETLPPLETIETTSTSESTTTTEPTTTTTEATTTTLSEREQAEVEIRQVVTDWWQLEYDTSQDGGEPRLEALTGLLRQRVAEGQASYEERGVAQRAVEPGPIEITSIEVDMTAGSAEVDACAGLTIEFFRGETGELLDDDDPDEPFVSEFQLQLVDGEWKISEWLSTALEGNPMFCEVTA